MAEIEKEEKTLNKRKHKRKEKTMKQSIKWK